MLWSIMNSFNYLSFSHVSEAKPSICILDLIPLGFLQDIAPSDIASLSHHLKFSFFISPFPSFYKHSFIHISNIYSLWEVQG